MQFVSIVLNSYPRWNSTMFELFSMAALVAAILVPTVIVTARDGYGRRATR
jgi:hypothetical protein